MRAWWRAAPHEVTLLGLCALITLGLVSQEAWLDASHVLLAMALYAGFIAWCARRSHAHWARARMASAYLITLWLYRAILWITPALKLTLRDDALLAADRWLFGESPAIAMQALTRPWVSELMSACYLSYHPYLHLALMWALTRPIAQARALYAYLFTTFAFGIAGYLMVPAVGPIRAWRFDAPIEGGPITRLNAAFIGQGTSVYDVFPSLHVLLTLSLLAYDWRWHRVRFWLMVPVSAGLVLSTMYLRYHYAIDVLAGFAWFAALRGWWAWRERAQAARS